MPTNEGVAVALNDVGKTYSNGFVALRGVRLAVDAGEWLVLVGPSGCGKTTTLRVIAGLEEPDCGTVHIAGRNVQRVPAWQRNVAMVFQRPALAPTQTVRGNLALGMRQADAGVVAAIAAWLGLDEVLERFPYQLSGGQQQRVALGRALARRAPLCLLDEPLGQLDAPLRDELRRELQLWRRRQPATMISVTHDPREAWALGDRIAIMDQGVVMQTGTPEEIERQPCHRFVAAFFAQQPMNFFEAVLRKQGNLLQWSASPWPLPVPCSAELPEGLEVSLGICASNVRIGSPGTCGMKVLSVERTPRGSWVTCEFRGRTITGWTERRVETGETVGVTMEWTKALIFDSKTGKTLGAPVG